MRQKEQRRKFMTYYTHFKHMENTDHLGGQEWADELTTSHSGIKLQPDSSDNKITQNHN